MNSVRQFLFNELSTLGTHLARIAWVNEYHGSTSFCRFVGRELHELRPRYISNGFSNAFESVLSHIFDVQFFKSNKLICLDQLTRKFMNLIYVF